MSTLDAAVPAAQPSLAARFRLPTGPIQFLGFDRDYWQIWIRGSVLLAVTLGIYRFWLTTDTRQFLWSNTEVLGEPLEYTGTARVGGQPEPVDAESDRQEHGSPNPDLPIIPIKSQKLNGTGRQPKAGG